MLGTELNALMHCLSVFTRAMDCAQTALYGFTEIATAHESLALKFAARNDQRYFVVIDSSNDLAQNVQATLACAKLSSRQINPDEAELCNMGAYTA